MGIELDKVTCIVGTHEIIEVVRVYGWSLRENRVHTIIIIIIKLTFSKGKV